MATLPGPGLPITLDATLDFMRLLWAIEHGLQRSSKRMEATLGVTGPQRVSRKSSIVRPKRFCTSVSAIERSGPMVVRPLMS